MSLQVLIQTHVVCVYHILSDEKKKKKKEAPGDLFNGIWKHGLWNDGEVSEDVTGCDD